MPYSPTHGSLTPTQLIVCRFGSASSDPIFLRASLSGRSHSTFVAVSPVPPATAALEAIGALAPGLLGANAPATLSSLGLDIGQATAAPASPAMPATTSAVTHAAIGFPSHRVSRSCLLVGRD